MKKPLEEVGTCDRCRDNYWKKHNLQKYCPDCKEIVKEQQRREDRIKARQNHPRRTITNGIMTEIHQKQKYGGY